MGKAKLLLPLAALLLAACGNLNLPGLQPKPFTGALDLASPLQTVAPGGQVQVPVREAAFRVEAMATRVVHLAVVDALYVALALRKPDAGWYLERSQEAIDAQRVSRRSP